MTLSRCRRNVDVSFKQIPKFSRFADVADARVAQGAGEQLQGRHPCISYCVNSHYRHAGRMKTVRRDSHVAKSLAFRSALVRTRPPNTEVYAPSGTAAT